MLKPVFILGLLPLSLFAYTTTSAIAGVRHLISMAHHMDPVGVKNKGVGFACSLGPHLRMDAT